MKVTFSSLKTHKKRLIIEFIVSTLIAVLSTLFTPTLMQFPSESIILSIPIIALFLTIFMETAQFILKKFLTFRKNFASIIPLKSFILLVVSFFVLYFYQIYIIHFPFYISLLTSALALASIRMFSYVRYRRHQPRQP